MSFEFPDVRKNEAMSNISMDARVDSTGQSGNFY
jgi:hypothetical protein